MNQCTSSITNGNNPCDVHPTRQAQVLKYDTSQEISFQCIKCFAQDQSKRSFIYLDDALESKGSIIDDYWPPLNNKDLYKEFSEILLKIQNPNDLNKLLNEFESTEKMIIEKLNLYKKQFINKYHLQNGNQLKKKLEDVSEIQILKEHLQNSQNDRNALSQFLQSKICSIQNNTQQISEELNKYKNQLPLKLESLPLLQKNITFQLDQLLSSQQMFEIEQISPEYPQVQICINSSLQQIPEVDIIKVYLQQQDVLKSHNISEQRVDSGQNQNNNNNNINNNARLDKNVFDQIKENIEFQIEQLQQKKQIMSMEQIINQNQYLQNQIQNLMKSVSQIFSMNIFTNYFQMNNIKQEKILTDLQLGITNNDSSTNSLSINSQISQQFKIDNLNKIKDNISFIFNQLSNSQTVSNLKQVFFDFTQLSKMRDSFLNTKKNFITENESYLQQANLLLKKLNSNYQWKSFQSMVSSACLLNIQTSHFDFRLPFRQPLKQVYVFTSGVILGKQLYFENEPDWKNIVRNRLSNEQNNWWVVISKEESKHDATLQTFGQNQNLINKFSYKQFETTLQEKERIDNIINSNYQISKQLYDIISPLFQKQQDQQQKLINEYIV